MPKTTTRYSPEEFKELVQLLLNKKIEIQFIVSECTGPMDQALGHSEVVAVEITDK